MEARTEKKIPGSMLVVAGCLDALQFIFSSLGLLTIAIPLIGIVLATLTFFANVLITVFALMGFSVWLIMGGHWKSRMLWMTLLAVFIEIFSTGIFPMWTLLIWRLKRGEKVEGVFRRKAVLRA